MGGGEAAAAEGKSSSGSGQWRGGRVRASPPPPPPFSAAPFGSVRRPGAAAAAWDAKYGTEQARRERERRMKLTHLASRHGRPPPTAAAGADPVRARARGAAADPRPVVRQAAVQALSALRGELVAAVAAPVICEGVVAVRVLREAKVAAERAIEGRRDAMEESQRAAQSQSGRRGGSSSSGGVGQRALSSQRESRPGSRSSSSSSSSSTGGLDGEVDGSSASAALAMELERKVPIMPAPLKSRSAEVRAAACAALGVIGGGYMQYYDVNRRKREIEEEKRRAAEAHRRRCVTVQPHIKRKEIRLLLVVVGGCRPD